jgi:hypothetical protein
MDEIEASILERQITLLNIHMQELDSTAMQRQSRRSLPERSFRDIDTHEATGLRHNSKSDEVMPWSTSEIEDAKTLSDLSRHHLRIAIVLTVAPMQAIDALGGIGKLLVQSNVVFRPILFDLIFLVGLPRTERARSSLEATEPTKK